MKSPRVLRSMIEVIVFLLLYNRILCDVSHHRKDHVLTFLVQACLIENPSQCYSSGVPEVSTFHFEVVLLWYEVLTCAGSVANVKVKFKFVCGFNGVGLIGLHVPIDTEVNL